MRLIKGGVLMALAALAAAAVLGAAPAGATTFCKAKEEVCAKGNRYPAGTTVKLKLAGSASEFKTSLGTIACTESSFEGKSTEESTGSSMVAIDTLWETFSFAGCKLGKTSCTVTVLWPWLVLWASLDKFPHIHSKVQEDPFALGGASGQIKCGALINCTYDAENAILEGESGTPASWIATEVPLKSSAGFCPEVAKWTANYEVPQPNPLWVSPEP